MTRLLLISLFALSSLASTLPISHPYGLYVVEVRVKVSVDNSCANSPGTIEPIVMGAIEYGPFRSYDDAEAWAHENVWPDQIGDIRQLRMPLQVLETPAARTLPLVTLKKGMVVK